MLPLTPRVWERKLLPTTIGIAPSSGWKHGRLVEVDDPTSSAHGWIYNHGGDWGDTVGNGSSQQEVYRYNPELDENLGDGQGWQKVHQYCGAALTAYPAGPDQVTAVWDSNRKRTWVLPGYMPGQPTNDVKEHPLAQSLSAGGNETEIALGPDPNGGTLQGWINKGWTARAIVVINDRGNNVFDYEWITYTGIDVSSLPHKLTGCTRGVGGTPKLAHPVGEYITISGKPPCGLATIRAAIPWCPFWFDVNTNRYNIAGPIRPAGMPVGEGSNNGFFDVVNDSIYRICGNMSSIRVDRIQCPALTTTSTNFTGLGAGTIAIGNNDIAYDPDNRIAYVLVPGSNPRMLRYDVANHTMTLEGGTSIPPRATTVFESEGINCFYPKWDVFNKVILWNFVASFSTGGEVPVIGSGGYYDGSGGGPGTGTGGRGSFAPLYVYHPTAGFGFPAKTWESVTLGLSSPTNPNGYIVSGNVAIFSKVHNAHILMGRGASSDPRFGGAPSPQNALAGIYFFRYASAAPAFRPIGVTATLGG